MKIRRLRILALEISKTLNGLNPSFMKELFTMRKGTYKRKNDLIIPTRNTVTFGDKSIKALGPHIWNALPETVKAETSYHNFRQ